MQQQARQQLGLTPTLLCWGVFCTLTSRRGREDERASSLTACFDVNYTSVSVSCARFSAASPPRALNQGQQQTVSSEPRPRTHENIWPGTEAGWRPGGADGSFQGVTALLTSCWIQSQYDLEISKMHNRWWDKMFIFELEIYEIQQS